MTSVLPLGSRCDLVIFDVDGTLHDAFAWWTPVIRRGLRQFAIERGIAVELPADRVATAVVGMKDAGVWAPFLPPPQASLWPELRKVVLPIEVAELQRGIDYMFPGIRELLGRLRARSVALALASNCRQVYMDAHRMGQGLAALTDAQYCLDSDGGIDKTGMLRAAVARFAAVAPVMVGDREPDLEAARAAGMPFVWRRNDRCDLAAQSDATWEGGVEEFLELVGLGAPRPGPDPQ